MGLPTAQLGSMSSLNVPSYIPTTVVRKDPKLWEQALMSLLTSTAGAVAGKGVENVMSREFADPAQGEKPASLFGRLTQGPTVDRAESTRRAASKEADNRLMAQVAGQIGLQELSDAPGAKDAIARNEAELNRSAAAQGQMRNITAQSKMGRRDADRADSRERDRQIFEGGQRGADRVETAKLHEAQIAASKAATEAQNAATKMQTMLYEMQKGTFDKQKGAERQKATAEGAEALRKKGAFEPKGGEKVTLMELLGDALPKTPSSDQMPTSKWTQPTPPPTDYNPLSGLLYELIHGTK